MKFCVKCGNEMSDEAAFCPKCGFKTGESPAPVQNNANDGKDLGLVSIIVGVVVSPIVGLICGIIGYDKAAKAKNPDSLKLNKAGIITSSILLFLRFVGIFVYIAFLFAFGFFS